MRTDEIGTSYEYSILSKCEFHSSAASFVVARHGIDPSAHRIAPHQPSVEGLQQVGRRGHIRHSRIEPNVVGVWIEDDWHAVVDG